MLTIFGRGAVALAVFIGTLTVAPPAFAGYLTGNDLYRYCTAASTDHDYSSKSVMCLAFIMGIHDGAETSGQLLTYMAERTEPFRMMCVPANVEAGQLKDITVAYLRDHPADRNQGAGIVVMSALLEAYPCASDQ